MHFGGFEWREGVLVDLPPNRYLNDAKILALIAALIKNAFPFQHWDRVAVIDPMLKNIASIMHFPNFLYGCRNDPELILAPIQTGPREQGHWTLLVIKPREGTAEYYDSMYNGRERVLPDGEAKRLIDEKYFPHLSASGYLDQVPVIMQADSSTYNIQVDGCNCGIHVVRIAEEIILYGRSRCLRPFYAELERERYFNGLRYMSTNRRLMDAWPQPLQQNQQGIYLRSGSKVSLMYIQ